MIHKMRLVDFAFKAIKNKEKDWVINQITEIINKYIVK